MVGTARFELATYGTQNRCSLLFTNKYFVNYPLKYGLKFKWLSLKRKLKGGAMRVVKLNGFNIATALKPSTSPITLPPSDEVTPPSYKQIDLLKKQINELQNNLFKEEKQRFLLRDQIQRLEAKLRSSESNTTVS